ncbi:MAG: NAD-dependent epimerase/dehydratase family protein [Mariprofundaceae bacterium]
MHVLVIGGCGFIGSHIVDELIAAEHNVSVIDRSTETFRPPLDGVKYYYEDILSITNAQEAIRAADIIIHSASSTNPASSNTNPQADVENNLIGMIQLLECMQQYNKKRILFLSSGGTVYGIPETLPIPEDHPLRPQCSYAIVKLAMEHYLNLYTKLHGFQTTIIRPANPYGPRQGYSGTQGVIAKFTAEAIHNEPLTLWGTGKEVRDFFHVSDLAKLCVKAVESNHTGLFNAGSGEGHSIREIANILESIHGSALQIDQIEGRNFDIPEVVLDIQKVKRDLDWSPMIPLREGMTDYYHWLTSDLSTAPDQ